MIDINYWAGAMAGLKEVADSDHVLMVVGGIYTNKAYLVKSS